MAQINLASNSSAILVANNSDKLQTYEFINTKSKAIRVNQHDVYAMIHKKNGTFFKQELYLGSTYLSAVVKPSANVSGTKFTYTFPPHSFTLLKGKLQK